MKKFVLFLMLLILFNACNTQYSEDDQTKEDFFCSSACSGACHIMVGSFGQILKSTNDSLTWEKVKSNTDKHLLDAYYASGNRFYVAGRCGTIAFSDDDGITWQGINASSKYDLFGIAVNENKIMTVGKSLVLLSSKDGGLNWKEMYKGAKQLSFYDIAFGNGFWIAVGDYSSVIVVNDETGEIITETKTETDKMRTLKSLAFDKTNNLWIAVGHEGVIFSSRNNGSSWEQKKSERTEDLLSVAFNGKRFVAVGTNGVILTSKDGNKWNKVQTNNNSTFRSVSCTDTHWLMITIDGKKEIIEDSKIEQKI